MLKDTLERDMQAGTVDREDHAPHDGGTTCASCGNGDGGGGGGGSSSSSSMLVGGPGGRSVAKAESPMSIGRFMPARPMSCKGGHDCRPGAARPGGCWEREVLARTLLNQADQLAQACMQHLAQLEHHELLKYADQLVDV